MILGIDTSCDETSVALYDAVSDRMIVNLVSSQIRLHAPYGGVVPELASRQHSENLAVLATEAFQQAGVKPSDLAGVAVTHTPGLIGCLLVGTSFAKALSTRFAIPLYAINHLEAHLFSPYVGRKPDFPFLGLVVSGGHTAFYRAESFEQIVLLGQTVDDAAGEAFDKGAKIMGLGYPGGPLVDKLARTGNDAAFPFTIPKVKMGPQYLSFSGIKTALMHHVRAHAELTAEQKRDIAASLERVIVDTLLAKADYFLNERGDYRALAVSGGVAMNTLLRRRAAEFCRECGVNGDIAASEYCTDNGGMIAYLAAHTRRAVSPLELTTAPTRKISARQLPRPGKQRTAEK